MAMNHSKLVYSTGVGRIREEPPKTTPLAHTNGVIHLRRESRGRGGKVVSVVEGIPADWQKTIGKMLKASCAAGGAVKGGAIEIQGDHRNTIKLRLEKEGFTVKFSGGQAPGERDR